MLVRNHLLCPYSDCIASDRSNELRIQVRINQDEDSRKVSLDKTFKTDKERTRLPYKYTYEVFTKLSCPYCNRPVEVVVDETHKGRNVNLRLPS
jgi:hypothetical protein